MYYSILVGFVFLSMTTCTYAMQDNTSRDSSPQLIRVTLPKRAVSAKAEEVKKLPKTNDPYFQELQKETQALSSLHKKKYKSF